MNGNTLSVDNNEYNNADFTGSITVDGGISKPGYSVDSSTLSLDGTLRTSGTVTLHVDGGNLVVNGAITGTGNIVVDGGAPVVNGTISTSGGVTVADNASLVVGSPNALAGTTVSIAPNGRLDLSRVTSANLGGLVDVGTINIGDSSQSAVAISIGASGLTSTIGGVSGSGSLTKTGNGSLVLAGASTTIAGTTVNAGTLTVNGTIYIPDPAVLTVGSAASVNGTGTIDATVNVGDSGYFGAGTDTAPGELTTGRLTLSSGGIFAALLAGSAPGTGYDQVQANGLVDLTGSTLSLRVSPGFAPSPGEQFDLIHNLPAVSISGQFGGLPDGAIASAGGQYFTVGYSAHDVTLTAISAPVASVQVNDGSAQRSELTSITITFSSHVVFDGPAAAAFELEHIQDSTDVRNLQAHVDDVQGHTVVTLTFIVLGNSPNEVDPLSGLNKNTAYPLGGQASLADGRYALKTGTYTTPADTYQGQGLGLYRLFGDVTGDGAVDATDLGQFSAAFNSNYGQQLYQWFLDADNSGAIDASDLSQFRARFNGNVF